jgi:peptide/nickel transport system permease protein
MIHGARISLSVGFVAQGIALSIGILLGALAGYFGKRVDMVISRLIEIVMTFPTFFLIITIIAFLPQSIYNIMIVIGLTGWTGIARFVRAEFLKLKNLDFVMASRALGASHTRLIFVHMLPNAMAPILVSAVFGIAGAILTESSLSFLGFGVPPPTPSWGDVLSQSRDYIEFAWWLTVFPGFAIFLSVTAYNLLGEGLRDAMDPKLFR